jgi:hypothetical protein
VVIVTLRGEAEATASLDPDEVSVKQLRMDSTEGWPKEKPLPAGEKTPATTSAPQRMESSLAFLKIPARHLEKHTCRTSSLSMRRISILYYPKLGHQNVEGEGEEVNIFTLPCGPAGRP